MRRQLRGSFTMRGYYLIVLALVALLAGCGGGGGSSVQNFTYQTLWNTPSGGIDGQSQLIELFDQNNILRFSAAIDKPMSSHIIYEVPNGLYHLHVVLYALPAEQGALVGLLDDQISVTGSVTYRTSVGPAITSVKLNPSSATLAVQHSQQFYAHSETGAHTPTFTSPNGFTWQTTGGVANVDSNGIVVGTAAGMGSVTATNVDQNIPGSASLTIQDSTPTHGKWTVIVFMNASNDLWPYSTLNMNQMEKVAQNPDVRFVVEWKESTNVDSSSTFNSTRRYLVKADTTSNIASQVIQDLGPGYDMGSAVNMADFIAWAKANYPADRYCVVVWNHGKGWMRAESQSRGVSYDAETGHHIDTWQLSQAFGNGVNDIVAWDSSLMQQIEVDDEIRDKATYIVGSEESPPAAGYPYDTIFAHFRDNPDDTTLNLAKTFVDETLTAYGTTFNITQSVIDTSQLPALVTATNGLADALINDVGSLGTIAPLVRSNAQGYDDVVIHGHYRDLYDVCLKLENFGAPPDVVTAEQAVRTAVGQAVAYNGHNQNSPGSHGISIDFSDSVSFTTGNPPLSQDYANLRFAQDTDWDQWLAIAP
ncbi:MAG TPA: clostripain-related cysteine peptidase [Fimbriimonadaceae bacterium]|nr:clostripain-related cysteine peptidase [Fimbriimonadaceae bacterium]